MHEPAPARGRGPRGPQGLDAPIATRDPIRSGAWIAVLAAVAFGVTTPLVQRLTSGASPLTTAALLYAGAAIASMGATDVTRESPVRWSHAPRLLAVGIVGGAIAPVCLVWGLGRTSAASASLMLNLETVFTVLLARALYAEPIGRRVIVAMSLMVIGGAELALRAGAIGTAGWGLVAIAGATLGWAFDNALTRPLSELDPRAVVRWKGLVGATLSVCVARALGEAWPSTAACLGLLVCGATCYGLSLRLYLRAQRTLGAARTGSIFAVAPFVGVAVAMALGDRADLPRLGIAAALFLAAVYLHATERHAHVHRHAPLVHEHAHRHDDGHHEHAHFPAIDGEHSHIHSHEEMEHAHAHAPDAHHAHAHS